MLAAEALRLAAVEALRPHACLTSDTGYPTLARHRVFDSRAPALKDLDEKQSFTPVLALFTAESGTRLRGPLTDATDTSADAVLDIVAELAIGVHDGNETYIDAMANGDPEARLVLGALISQVRYVLDHADAGRPFRRICRRIVKQENMSFAIPELGLRYHRVTMRLHCEIRDDDFDVAVGDLPEPMRSLHASLPDGSYAKTKLAALSQYFNPETHPTLVGVTVTSGPVDYGA